ncbi:hypothetical protein SCHPADRAFT_893172 [Schizopora paradoxa]|uniref:Uncharacterized protein n=1 Tax=Schizopora paradoxa TaxID=27342 RepID=A0A0H2RBV8_9AGAM|nr:hypothetical protein SCHPADRAFT_893172 [Schizopora paradoxa]
MYYFELLGAPEMAASNFCLVNLAHFFSQRYVGRPRSYNADRDVEDVFICRFALTSGKCIGVSHTEKLEYKSPGEYCAVPLQIILSSVETGCQWIDEIVPAKERLECALEIDDCVGIFVRELGAYSLSESESKSSACELILTELEKLNVLVRIVDSIRSKQQLQLFMVFKDLQNEIRSFTTEFPLRIQRGFSEDDGLRAGGAICLFIVEKGVGSLEDVQVVVSGSRVLIAGSGQFCGWSALGNDGMGRREEVVQDEQEEEEEDEGSRGVAAPRLRHPSPSPLDVVVLLRVLVLVVSPSVVPGPLYRPHVAPSPSVHRAQSTRTPGSTPTSYTIHTVTQERCSLSKANSTHLKRLRSLWLAVATETDIGVVRDAMDGEETQRHARRALTGSCECHGGAFSFHDRLVLLFPSIFPCTSYVGRIAIYHHSFELISSHLLNHAYASLRSGYGQYWTADGTPAQSAARRGWESWDGNLESRYGAWRRRWVDGRLVGWKISGLIFSLLFRTSDLIQDGVDDSDEMKLSYKHRTDVGVIHHALFSSRAHGAPFSLSRQICRQISAIEKFQEAGAAITSFSIMKEPVVGVEVKGEHHAQPTSFDTKARSSRLVSASRHSPTSVRFQIQILSLRTLSLKSRRNARKTAKDKKLQKRRETFTSLAARLPRYELEPDDDDDDVSSLASSTRSRAGPSTD